MNGRQNDRIVAELCALLQVGPEQLVDRVRRLLTPTVWAVSVVNVNGQTVVVPPSLLPPDALPVEFVQNLSTTIEAAAMVMRQTERAAVAREREREGNTALPG